MMRTRSDATRARVGRFRGRTLGVLLVALATAAGARAADPSDSARASGTTWNDYLDHAYVFSAADAEDLRALLDRTTLTVGRSLSEYHAETFPALVARGTPLSEAQVRRKAIAELLLHRIGERRSGLDEAILTLGALEDRLDRHENRFWYHTVHAHAALRDGNAEAFVDQILTLWLEVITPLEVPFETYRTLALNETGNAGFVRTLPHLYESVARLVLVHSQTAALDADIDSLGAIVRVLTDERVGADPDSIPVDATSKALLDHVVARLDGPESDGGSLSYTLALVEAERAHQIARRRLADEGLSEATETAIRDSVAGYQRAMRNANTLQGQVAVYGRALRLLGEIHATGQRTGEPVRVDVPFSLERAYELHARLHAAKDGDWAREGYVDQGRAAYVQAMQDLWSEIQEASFNTAHYYMSRRDALGEPDDEALIHAINLHSRYLHAYQRFEQEPASEALPDSATFGAYLAARGVGDGILFFAGGDASVAQLEEAIARYGEALAHFPFDRALWSTMAVALQRSGRESDFLAVAKPIANAVVRSRHLDRWIEANGDWAQPLASFRRAFENDRSLVYFGFADDRKIDALETEFARLQAEREQIESSIAATRSERETLHASRRDAHRRAAELSGEASVPAPPEVAAARPDDATTSDPDAPRARSREIARLGLEIERLGSSHDRLDARIEAIAQSLPIWKATLGHEALLDELASRRDHPLHALLRRLGEEYDPTTPQASAPETGRGSATRALGDETVWNRLQAWLEESSR